MTTGKVRCCPPSRLFPSRTAWLTTRVLVCADDFKDASGRQHNINSRPGNVVSAYRGPGPGRTDIQNWGKTYRVSAADSLFTKGNLRGRFQEVDVELVSMANDSQVADGVAESACGSINLDPDLAAGCIGDIKMTGDMGYIEEYKETQQMANEAKKDRETLQKLADEERALQLAAEEPTNKIEKIQVAPSQDAVHHLEE